MDSKIILDDNGFFMTVSLLPKLITMYLRLTLALAYLLKIEGQTIISEVDTALTLTLLINVCPVYKF